ncbi:DUF3871 family protein [Algoriphagus pacificus]|uniref:DUF3871 family protein n=1 Tax=Algoriphagus pacificus TaxID=2811234 RepID=A0ABS3CI70_9BACT|nr:DUF3871 family protein [Algoriphagus pacificus]MBN7816793.1 DUF3871 family protein [Algoriphagus pacificus]
MNLNFNPFGENEEFSQSNGVVHHEIDLSQSISLPARKPFIEANTMEVKLQHLSNDCIIPVFAKDNERTISHQEFIDSSLDACLSVIPGINIELPEIRVSHQIKGRTPDAIHKPASQLLDNEKTIYYERMAFIARIPEITEKIGGNTVSLAIGGVRSYNLENLYQKKSMEKFKFFIGFQNLVCCNLCVSTDGYQEQMKASSLEQLSGYIMSVIQNYKVDKHILQMKELSEYSLTEQQFAQLVGRCRLYQHLSKDAKKSIPELHFTDGQINLVAKDFYQDESFSRDDRGDINLWNVYNLFTQANKSSYIDTFLDRSLNALEFTTGIQNALKNEENGYEWFLS